MIFWWLMYTVYPDNIFPNSIVFILIKRKIVLNYKIYLNFISKILLRNQKY
jgi:hypothetical protein